MNINFSGNLLFKSTSTNSGMSASYLSRNDARLVKAFTSVKSPERLTAEDTKLITDALSSTPTTANMRVVGDIFSLNDAEYTGLALETEQTSNGLKASIKDKEGNLKLYYSESIKETKEYEQSKGISFLA